MSNQFLSLIATAALLSGCGAAEPSVLRDAAAGHAIVVTVTERADGTLIAEELQLEQRSRGGDADENIPIEDLPQAVVDAMNAQFPGATWLAAEEEGGEYGIEFISADGQHLGAEFDAEGTLLEVENEDGPDDDDDDDGDVDGEDARYALSLRHSFISGVPTVIADRGVYQLFGIEVNAGGQPVPDGAVRFTGDYNGGAYFSSAWVTSAPALLIGGYSQGVKQTGSGYTLKVMDRTVTIDDHTRIITAADPLKPSGQ